MRRKFAELIFDTIHVMSVVQLNCDINHGSCEIWWTIKWFFILNEWLKIIISVVDAVEFEWLIWWEFKTKIISVFARVFSHRKIISSINLNPPSYVSKKRSPRSIFKYKHSPLAAAADQSQTIIASYTHSLKCLLYS